jgi:hypothetical protein
MRSDRPQPQPSDNLLAAAARRFTILLVGTALVTIVGSALLGLAFGSSLNRAISIGLYLVGSFLIIAGVFVGSRGPARLKADPDAHEALARGRRVRWASRDERLSSINESAIFVSMGFLLIVLGTVIDARVSVI